MFYLAESYVILCCLSIIISIPEGISEFTQGLRGDSRKEAIDIYDHRPEGAEGSLFGVHPTVGDLAFCRHQLNARGNPLNPHEVATKQQLDKKDST